MSKREDILLEELHRLNEEFWQLTGHMAFLYASRPADVTYYTFTEAPPGGRQPTSAKDAVYYLQDLLAKAKAGERLWW